MSIVGTSSQTPRFSPDTLPGLRLWLDAADRDSVVLSGSNVTQWNDKSGNLRNGTPVNGLTYSAASNAVVFTRASSQFLTLPDNTFPIGSSSFSIFFVFTPAATAYEIIMITAGARGGNIFGIRSGNAGTGTLQTFWSGNNDIQTSNLWARGQRNIGAFLYQAGGTRSLWVNGVQGASDTPGAQTAITTSNCIGTLGSGAFNTFDGQMHEVLVFESSLSVTERQQVESYLAQKWDLAPSPLSIPGCVFWLDAGDRSTLTLSASNTITGWTEKSGANRTVTTNSTGIYSATAMNGRPGIQFSAGNVMTSSTAATLGNNLTAFVVFMATSPGPVQLNVPIFVGSSANGYWLTYRGDFQIYQARQEGGAQAGNSYYRDINIPIIMAGVASATASQQTAFLNGYSTDVVNSAPLSNVGATTIYIPGGEPYWGGPANGMFNGVISEILLFSNALTTTQRQTIEGYLSSKWGISVNVKPPFLPATHAFPRAPPAVRAFSPLDVDGLAIWLDAADSASYRLSGSNVTQFNDKQGLITLTASSAFATVGTQPGFTFASNTSTYTATTTITPAAFTTSSTDFTLAIIANHTTEGIVNALPFNIGISGPRLCPFFSYDGVPGRVSTFADCAAPADPRLSAGNSIVSGSPSVVIYRRSGSTVTLRIAGLTAASNTFSSPSSFASSNYTVTMSPGGAKWWGTLYEVLHYSAALSDGDIGRLEGYIADKWGLRATMGGVSHPYRFGPAMVLPTQIPGCALWLDATDSTSMTLSGSNVTQWRDKSSNAYAGTAVGNPVRTTVEGYSAVTFDGTSQYINFGDVADVGAAPLNIFTVSKFNTTGDGTLIAKSLLGEAASRYALIRTGGSLIPIVSGSSSANQPTVADTNTARRILSWTWDRTTQTLYRNGVSFLSSAFSNTETLNSSYNLLVGAYNNGTGGVPPASGLFLNGSINEIVCIFGTMTTLQRQQIEGYLAWKWGLQASLTPSTTLWTQVKRALTPVFVPNQIPGCALWLDAADAAVFNGGATWTDKSGTDNHGINGTPGSSTMPTVTTWPNGLTAARFVRASKNSVKTTNVIPTLNITYYFVVRLTGADGAKQQLMINNVDGRRQIYTLASSFPAQVVALAAPATAATNVISVAQSVPFIYGATFSGGFNLYVNGTDLGSSSLSDSVASRHYFGSADGDGDYMSGDYGEILIYTTALTTPQRQRIEGYLAHKWGLLPEIGGGNVLRAGPSSILPTQIAGCMIWLDAADSGTFTLSGSNVTQWRDKSGNANHFSTLAGTSPTYSSNEVAFPSGGVMRSSASIALTLNTYAVIVFKLMQPSDFSYVLSFTSMSPGGYTGHYSIRANTGILGGTAASPGDGADFGNATYFVNGTFNPSFGTGTYSNSPVIVAAKNTNLTGTTTVELSAAIGRYFVGRMYEVILYSSPLTTTQRQTLETYLAWKWGIQQSLAASTHPYKVFKP